MGLGHALVLVSVLQILVDRRPRGAAPYLSIFSAFFGLSYVLRGMEEVFFPPKVSKTFLPLSSCIFVVFRAFCQVFVTSATVTLSPVFSNQR